MTQFHFQMIMLLAAYINITPVLQCSEAQKTSRIQTITDSIIAAKQEDVVRQSLACFRQQEMVPATDDEIGDVFQCLVLLMPSDHSSLGHESTKEFRLYLEQGNFKRIHYQLHNGQQRIGLLGRKYQAIREIAESYYSILRLERKGCNQYINPDGWVIDLDSLLEMGPSTKINGPLIVQQPKTKQSTAQK